MESKLHPVFGKRSCCYDEHRNLEKIYSQKDELFNNADKKMIQGTKLVRDLIHEDNTSLSLSLEEEENITKATSEEKFTATLVMDHTMEKKSTNATMQEKSKKIQNPIYKKAKRRLQ